MKLTLFTISNEQIKEQLSKLQTKVESLEAVKDVQDKILSAKDSQITFLQGEISSITTWVTWGAGLVITLASAAFIFIKLLESKAKKKIEEAESTLQLATEKLTEIETAKQQTEINLTESDLKIEQLNSLIDRSNNIATVAQEKIDELEEKQVLLQKQADEINSKQKLDMKFNHIRTKLDLIKDRYEFDRGTCPPEYIDAFHDLLNRRGKLETRYRVLFTDIGNNIIKDIQITEKELSKIEKLKQDVQNFFNDYITLFVKFTTLNNEE